MKSCLRIISCYCLFLIPAFFPLQLIAASRDFSANFYQHVDHFLKNTEIRSEPLVQEAHQIVQHLSRVTKNRESFVERIKELKAYLRLVCDFSKLKTLQRTLILEKEINAHVESWNQETRRKQGVITWAALAAGVMVGIFAAIISTAKENNLDVHQIKEKLKMLGVNILIWAPLTIGGGLGLAHLITAKEVEERQVLLVHPAELIKAHSMGVSMYDMESYLKSFLTSKKESARSHIQKKLHTLYSKAPEQMEARIQYMKEVLEYAPQKLNPPKAVQQRRLQALQENFSLQPLSNASWDELRYLLSNHMYAFAVKRRLQTLQENSSLQPLSNASWDELRYLLSDHMYAFAVTGAFLGVAIFLLSLYLTGNWSWPSLALSLLIGLNVGLSIGQMAGDLIKKETAQEILHYEVLF